MIVYTGVITIGNAGRNSIYLESERCRASFAHTPEQAIINRRNMRTNSRQEPQLFTVELERVP